MDSLALAAPAQALHHRISPIEEKLLRSSTMADLELRWTVQQKKLLRYSAMADLKLGQNTGDSLRGFSQDSR
jgi:hypothetical protein